MLYEMTTGTRAFQRETPVQTLSAIITDEAPPIASRSSGAPAQLHWIIERCLAKDPSQRYAATRDLAHDLSTLRDRLAETTTATAAAPSNAARWRLKAGVLFVVAVAMLAVGIVWWNLRPGKSSREQNYLYAPMARRCPGFIDICGGARRRIDRLHCFVSAGQPRPLG
jgi:hypothetical protein